MNFPDFSPDKLKLYYQQINLVELTANQLIKDFEWSNLTVEFPENSENPYNDLSQQVVPLVDLMIQQNSHKLLNLLYKIDVNEHQFIKILDEFTGLKLAEELTHLIIEREFKKVLIKEYFKKQQNP